MNKKVIIGVIIGIVSLILLTIASFIVYFFVAIGPVNKNESLEFKIETGTSTLSIIKKLKQDDLIKDEFAAKIYLFLHKGISFQAGNYELNKKMSLEEIFIKFINGDVKNDNYEITFVEGKRIPDYAKTIASKLEIGEDEVLKVMNDKEFLNELINKYWFITDEILNKNIYYPLEGYLYPNTYQFTKEATVKDIIIKLIDNLGLKLEAYKDEIINSKYTPHQFLTLASIVELEAATDEDRENVAGVFYNRLSIGMSLGSDVTTYYATKKKFTDPLTLNELNACNSYNTRGSCVKALPVGPITSPSISSIKAAIEPAENDYLFFVADKTKKVYFSKTNQEQLKVIEELKKANLWL